VQDRPTKRDYATDGEIADEKKERKETPRRKSETKKRQREEGAAEGEAEETIEIEKKRREGKNRQERQEGQGDGRARWKNARKKGWVGGWVGGGSGSPRQALPLPLIYIDIMHSDPMCVNPAMRT
jgi:hypothetical protein